MWGSAARCQRLRPARYVGTARAKRLPVFLSRNFQIMDLEGCQRRGLACNELTGVSAEHQLLGSRWIKPLL